MNVLLTKMVRLAHTTPSPKVRHSILAELRELGVLPKLAVSDKEAIAQSTQDFYDWVFSSRQGSPLSPGEVVKIAKSVGVPELPPMVRRKGDRYSSGDQVALVTLRGNSRFNASDPKWSGEEGGPGGPVIQLEPFFGQTGQVVKTDSKGCTVKWGSQMAYLPWGQKSRGIPLYKHMPKFNFVNKGPQLEMIYIRGQKGLSEEQKVVATNYVGRAKGSEPRAEMLQYYTGYGHALRQGKNGYYLQMTPQQRYNVDPMQVDPQTNGPNGEILVKGVQWRSFNPASGECLYIGRLGSRPSGWEKQFAAIKAQALQQP
jgi:hypothetical protein